ncbi:MAG: flagellar basal body rod protein FlgB [Thermovenabulum sp.]|uniref:flagellar basal body rod protein FlgB n=2 Tax=Thermovenabulum sp. TaxID=3100335 RepID=UPI003C7B4D07
MGIFDKISLMGRVLDAKWLRNEVIANNIANADTPNYKKSKVVFEDYLKKFLDDGTTKLGLKTTNDKHIKNLFEKNILGPIVYQEKDTLYRNDGNNVDIEKEMVELTGNSLSYNVLADQVSKEFSLLRTVINEGRK